MFSADKRLVATAFFHAHMELTAMKCDANLQAENVKVFGGVIPGQHRAARIN